MVYIILYYLFYKPLSITHSMRVKYRSNLAEYFLQLFTIEINSAIANNLKPIGMMKMLCVIIYENIYECVSDYMKHQHDHFWTFTDILRTKQDSWALIRQNKNSFREIRK